VSHVVLLLVCTPAFAARTPIFTIVLQLLRAQKGATLLAIVIAVQQFLFMWWLSAYNLDGAAATAAALGASAVGADAVSDNEVAAPAAAVEETPSAAPAPAAVEDVAAE